MLLKAALFSAFLILTCSGCSMNFSDDDIRSSGNIDFNSDFIEQVHNDAIDLDNHRDVLRFILSNAGDTIKIYPSEGYFYFSFHSNGVLVKGNLRFDKYLRDEGRVSFAYFRHHAGIRRRTIDRDKHWTLGPEDDFFLTKTDLFHYNLKFEETTIAVEIYDATTELHAEKPVSDGEIYVGPVFDESGVRFHLIFDQLTNVFLFLRNTDLGPAETVRQLEENPSILIGNRSRFAYYDDVEHDRQVLIGVNKDNVRTNTLYDGPFDQLPDSFVDPVYFMELILLYKPSLQGKIGPGGIFLSDSDMRTGLYPYLDYDYERQLLGVSQCESSASRLHEFNRCLARWSAR